MIVLGFGLISFSLLQSMVGPVLPLIGDMYGSNTTTTAWVMTAYMVSASVFTPIVGRMGDRLGKRAMMVTSLIALAAGSVLAAMAWNIEILLLARVVQGAGGGLIPLALGVIREHIEPRRVASAYGATAAVLGLGNGLGLALAGPLVEYVGYPSIFLGPALISTCAAIASVLYIPTSEVKSPNPIRVAPALLLSLWLVTLLVPITQGAQWGWTSPATIGLLAISSVTFAAWIRQEGRATHPLIDLTMLKHRVVGTVNLTALLFAVAVYPLFALLPAMLQSPRNTPYGHGATVTEVGRLLVSEAIAAFIGSLVAGRLANRTGWKALFVLGTILGCIGYLLLGLAHSEEWHIVFAATILGLAVGLAFSAMTGLVADAVPMSKIGVAGGVTANLRTVGGAVGIALSTSLVGSTLDVYGNPTEGAYVLVFLSLAAIAAIAAVLASTLPRRDAMKRVALATCTTRNNLG
ncbi:hypothetical protein CH300_05370 [Rhodococcus sp. 15-1154-1]|nr:hypothetical protein CH300_05370 [Rhodococcus sp. 15-1154-1]